MKYKPRLDGLRCIAVLMVLVGHFLYFVAGTNSGIFGVNLFFVLSGFLITSILLSDRSASFRQSYKNFIVRRALRIFPIYYLIVIFFILINAEGIKADWPYLLTYTYNFHVSGSHGWEYHLYSAYWSLSVEEQFYLFFPFVVLFFKKYPNILLFTFFTFIIVALSERIFHFTHIHPYVNLITNMAALTTGAIAAWFFKHQKLNDRFFNSIFVEITMLLIFLLVFLQGENMIGFIFYPFVNVYFVIKAAAFSFRIKPIDKSLLSRPAIFIGRISYGIYLYHIMVRYFFDTYIFDPLWNRIPFSQLGYFSKIQYNKALIEFPILLFLVIVISYLSFRFIEMPFLKLKDKYAKKEPSLTNPVLVS